ncbi:MAG TPA: hypothetical protein VK824_03825 [Planctomycetota bacterium]|nr:hypothetical protein [Planctomycetota bacterium]
MAYLVQLLIPVTGTDEDARRHAAVRDELLARFGGVTAYNRAPATGLWKDASAPRGNVVRDDIVVYEVLSARLPRSWWKSYAGLLRRRFDQTALVIHAHTVQVLPG